MTETLFPQENQEPRLYHSWEAESTLGHFETYADFKEKIRARLHVLGDDESAGDKPVMGFVYDPDEYDTNVMLTDENDYCVGHVHVTVPEFLESSSGDMDTRETILSSMTTTWINRHDDEQWWLQLHGSRGLDSGYIESHDPTEQLIVGDGKQGVRFFNYGSTMLPEQTNDCRRFIELLTQYFGDKVYDLLTDVVIAPFNEEDQELDGCVDLPHVIFINSLVLNNAEEGGSRIDESSRLMEVLVHEFGHLLHGRDDKSTKQLLEFARAVGWNVDTIVADPDWQRHTDLSMHAPAEEYIVTMEDGTPRRMPVDEYYENFEQKYDDEGNVVDSRPFYELGSPTKYGTTNPRETYAETTTRILLGEYAVRHMPETRDAWLDHVGKRLPDRPIATPLDRHPIGVEKRTGYDILYPASSLPTEIYVRAKARR